MGPFTCINKCCCFLRFAEQVGIDQGINNHLKRLLHRSCRVTPYLWFVKGWCLGASKICQITPNRGICLTRAFGPGRVSQYVICRPYHRVGLASQQSQFGVKEDLLVWITQILPTATIKLVETGQVSVSTYRFLTLKQNTHLPDADFISCYVVTHKWIFLPKNALCFYKFIIAIRIQVFTYFPHPKEYRDTYSVYHYFMT